MKVAPKDLKKIEKKDDKKGGERVEEERKKGASYKTERGGRGIDTERETREEEKWG